MKNASRHVINTTPYGKSEIGFFEEIKLNKFGQPIDKRYVHDGYGKHIERPCDGKILMIHIKNDAYTTIVREATEKDKEKFREAYQLFIKEKSAKEDKERELEELKKQVEKNKEKTIKENKDK